MQFKGQLWVRIITHFETLPTHSQQPRQLSQWRHWPWAGWLCYILGWVRDSYSCLPVGGPSLPSSGNLRLPPGKGIMWLGCVTDHFDLCTTEAKNAWSYTPTCPFARKVLSKAQEQLHFHPSFRHSRGGGISTGSEKLFLTIGSARGLSQLHWALVGFTWKNRYFWDV
jgi:hypothetical protein